MIRELRGERSKFGELFNLLHQNCCPFHENEGRRERARESAGDKERESERKRGVRDGEREDTGGEGEGGWGGQRQKE